MADAVTEIYRPHTVLNLGLWDIGPLRWKVYGLLADGKEVSEAMRTKMRDFIGEEVLPRVKAEGDSNDLGFVIIHPGDWGISIAAHWWIQGSVLCQHIYRQLYDADGPMDTVTRPVIGCVWELQLIAFEHDAWRRTMMTSTPASDAYLEARAAGNLVQNGFTTTK